MVTNQGGGIGSRAITFLRHHAPAFILGVIASVVASLAITWLGYSAGYTQGRIEGVALGREAGENARYAELDTEIESARSERMIELNDEITTRRQERMTALDAEIERARSRRLVEIESEMDRLIMAKCGRELQGEYNRGRDTGYEDGLFRGHAECERRVAELRREMENACAARINEARSNSVLWNRFENLILSSGEYSPEDEEAVRTYVEAVIRVALAGREAGNDIAEVFNGDIDDLVEALNADDMERALAIIERLKLTLPDIYSIFEPAFAILALGLEQDNDER